MRNIKKVDRKGLLKTLLVWSNPLIIPLLIGASIGAMLWNFCKGAEIISDEVGLYDDKG